MADDGENLTPFWVQNTTDLRRTDRLRNWLSSLFFNAGNLLIILLVTAVFFLVFVLPPTLSIFKPSNVKKSWDSLNVVLVLVAVIFGFLSRNKNEDRNTNEYQQIASPVNRNEIQKSNPSTPTTQWFDEIRNSNPNSNPNPNTPRTWFDNVGRSSFSSHSGGGSLRRSFSSYPDLSEVSPRWISGEDHWRFYDDTQVDNHRFSDPGQLNRRRSWRDVDRSPEPEIRTIYEYPLENKRVPTFAPPASIPPPLSPPSPPPAPVPEKVKKVSQSVPRKKERASKRRENHEQEANKVLIAPATLPPPPPPPPPLPRYVEPRSSKSDRKRGGASATKEFINSLYHKKKRKNRSKSVDNFDALLHKSIPPPLYHEWPASSTPPPPPPPPPPPSLFQNLFTSKKTRRKRNAPPPPPPPPPPVKAVPVRISRLTTQNTPFTRTTPTPKPVKVRSFDSVEENSNSGGESPLIPIPPPPPPPPPFFRKHAWKFVVQGDYVRIDSTVSSRSGSPDLEDIDSADNTPTAEDTGAGERTAFAPSPLFCPSPDVNTKAENFISKFRAGLKQEKINSFKKIDLGRSLSNLGPGAGQS